MDTKRERERERERSTERGREKTKLLHTQNEKVGKTPSSEPTRTEMTSELAKVKVIIDSHKSLICYDTLIPVWLLLAYMHIKLSFISEHADKQLRQVHNIKYEQWRLLQSHWFLWFLSHLRTVTTPQS